MALALELCIFDLKISCILNPFWLIKQRVKNAEFVKQPFTFDHFGMQHPVFKNVRLIVSWISSYKCCRHRKQSRSWSFVNLHIGWIYIGSYHLHSWIKSWKFLQIIVKVSYGNVNCENTSHWPKRDLRNKSKFSSSLFNERVRPWEMINLT